MAFLVWLPSVCYCPSLFGASSSRRCSIVVGFRLAIDDFVYVREEEKTTPRIAKVVKLKDDKAIVQYYMK